MSIESAGEKFILIVGWRHRWKASARRCLLEADSGRPGVGARCFFRPTPADLGSNRLKVFERFISSLGAMQRIFPPKIQDYYGSGWVGPGLTRNFFFFGKSSQNSSKPVLIFWSSIPLCILSVYTLIKVVSYYDLSVLSMTVMDFQKKLDGVGGWGKVYLGFFLIFGIF